jgi:replication initiation and membrane attachment protein DnaB
MNNTEVKNVLAKYHMAKHNPKVLVTFIAEMEASLSSKDIQEVHARVERWKHEIDVLENKENKT